MADPLSIAGVAYPIVKDFLRLARSMKKAYQGIRYANHDLFKTIKRTETIAQTFDFFSESLHKAEGIEELESMFEQHRKLIKSVNDEAKRTIKKLKYITTICRLMMNCPHVNPVQRWIAHFEWYRANKNTVPLLFQDMKVLERSMRTLGTLVNTQILHQVFFKTKNDSILIQLESFQKLLKIEFRKLQEAQKTQQEFYMRRKISPYEEVEQPFYFASEVLRILKEEIPRTFRENRFDDTPTNISQLGSISLVSESPPSVTRTPESSQVKGKDQGIVSSMNDDSAPMAGESTSCSIPNSERPQTPLIVVINSSVSLDRWESDQKNKEVSNSELDYSEQQESGAAYMCLPPFGSPKLRPRPRAGRKSLDHPNNTSDEDDSNADNS